MDIDLLSKMVKELIPDHDRVSLPGFGCFVTEVVPSAFSDRGYTINPPYRRLSFRTGNISEDSLLADLYASSNDVEPDVARKIISEFISEMKKILMARKTVVFPGLGRMRATRENNFFFVADEDLDIYPEGFGLEPVSLKSHQETKEEVSAMISGLQSMMEISDGPVKSSDAGVPAEEPAAVEPGDGRAEGSEEGCGGEDGAWGAGDGNVGPVIEEETSVEAGRDDMGAEEAESVAAEEETESADVSEAEETKETEPAAEPQPDGEDTESPARKLSPWKIVLIVAGSIIGLAVLLLAAYLLAAHFCPDFIDSILYDSEQLDVLRYGQGRSIARTCFIGF